MIVVGIDPHKQTHTAVALDAATGRTVGELQVKARTKGFDRLLTWGRSLDGVDRFADRDAEAGSARPGNGATLDSLSVSGAPSSEIPIEHRDSLRPTAGWLIGSVSPASGMTSMRCAARRRRRPAGVT